MFEGSSCVGLNGLKYTEDKSTVEWEKRKEGYSPDIILPTDFQELLKGNFGDMCSFLYALHLVNINKETMNRLSSRCFLSTCSEEKDASVHEPPL